MLWMICILYVCACPGTSDLLPPQATCNTTGLWPECMFSRILRARVSHLGKSVHRRVGAPV